MKGLVFTEFMDMVEDKFGMEMADHLIETTNPPSGGAYTSVGTYNHQELIDMVVELSKQVHVDASELVRQFGHHLAQVFQTKFTGFFEEVNNTIDFLKKIENHIHVEVKKLYPDAELPKFSYDESDPNQFILRYESSRGLADLAQGLIEALGRHYGEDIALDRTDDNTESMYRSTFTISKR